MLDIGCGRGKILGDLFKKLKLIHRPIGLDIENVVSARVFLTHFERDYQSMNEVYASYFNSDRLPARTCIGVTALACGALVEIDMVARRS